jgi:hypothetical protein
MTDRLRGRWTWTFAGIAAILVVVIVLGPGLMRLVFEPMAWLLWAAWRIAASVDQRTYWGLLVLAGAALVIRLVPGQLWMGAEQRATYVEWNGAGDRLRYWQEAARRSMNDYDARTALGASLASLARSVAESNRLPPPLEANQRRYERGPDWIHHMLPNIHRKAEVRRIEALLDWLEESLEIQDER